MIGCIVLGGLAAVGIASIARRHHHRHGGWHRFGHHHGRRGCGPGARFGWDADDLEDAEDSGWHHRAHGGWASRIPNPLGYGAGRAFLLRRVLRRLETTPTQSDAIREALKEFEASAQLLRGEGKRTRADLAATLRRPAVDAESLGELFARHDSAIEGARKSFVGLTIKVHDILDDTQRERLAELLERGPRSGRHAESDEGAW